MLPFFDQEHSGVRERVRAWVDTHLSAAPGESELEEKACVLVKQLGADGILAYTVAQKHGGIRRQVQARDLCLIREELARGSALADTMFAVQALGSYPITLYGTEEQKNRYLPRIAGGEAIAAFALTEPEAGSDVSALQTRAARRGDSYILNGTKRFVSNAGIAHSYVVFASTEPERKAKGISAFVVDAKLPGLVLREKTSLLSPHPIGVIGFEDCVVPASEMIGSPGEGLKVAFGTLDLLRCTVGAAALGLAQRALEEAIRYSQSRKQFGQSLAGFQAIQFKLADMATELEAARLLVYRSAWAHDCGGENPKQTSSMAKLFATEAAQHVIDQGLQIHGGAGVVVGNIMERLYRDIRALRIYEGTSEIQKLVIARELLSSSEVKAEG
jgi:acyl-CoA dehydrogenase